MISPFELYGSKIIKNFKKCKMNKKRNNFKPIKTICKGGQQK